MITNSIFINTSDFIEKVSKKSEAVLGENIFISSDIYSQIIKHKYDALKLINSDGVDYYSIILPSCDRIRIAKGSVAGLVIKDLFNKNKENTDMEKCVNTISEKKVVNNTVDSNKNNLFKIEFGSCENNSNVRLSTYGLSIKNKAGTWVSYDKTNNMIVDVDILNFEAGQFIFRIPVAVNQIQKGDVIIHNRVPMFVLEILGSNMLSAIDPYAGESKSILLPKNIFGFNYATKIITIIDQNSFSPDSPFGNALPFLFMSECSDSNNNMSDLLMYSVLAGNTMDNNMMLPLMMMSKGNNDNNTMLMAMMMSQQNAGNMTFDMNNPMMIYALMNNDKNNSNMLPFLLMSQQQTQNNSSRQVGYIAPPVTKQTIQRSEEIVPPIVDNKENSEPVYPMPLNGTGTVPSAATGNENMSGTKTI